MHGTINIKFGSNFCVGQKLFTKPRLIRRDGRESKQNVTLFAGN